MPKSKTESNATLNTTLTTTPESGVATTEPAAVQGTLTLTKKIADMFKPLPGQTAIAPLSERFSVSRRLTRPMISIGRKGMLAVAIMSEMYERDIPVAGKTELGQKTTLVEVTDLETGEESTLICNALIKSALERAVAPIAGRFFAMRAGEIRDGKRYRDVDVVELQPTK